MATAAKLSSQNAPVGFVGLGNMGGHMARNLIKKGYPVIAFDIDNNSLNELKKSGNASYTALLLSDLIISDQVLVVSSQFFSYQIAEIGGADIASSPADVASKTERIVSMLPASQHVRNAYTGTDGILSKVKKNCLLIDSSTIDPSVSQELSQESEKVGATFVDAPVSGGVNAARDAILTFMVGGPESAYNAASEILSNMGKNVVHCGSVGTGQAAKICNNMLLAISMIGTSETMNLGMRLGLDPKLLAKILNMSSGRCWSSEIYNPCPGVLEGVPSSNNYQGGFGTALMTKDLGLAQNAATVTKSATPLGSLAHQIYRVMCNSGFDKKDFSSAFLFLQEQNQKD